MYYYAAVVCLQPHRPISQYAAERISQKRCLQYADTVVAHMPVALNGRIVTDCDATRETHLSCDKRVGERARFVYRCNASWLVGCPYLMGAHTVKATARQGGQKKNRPQWWIVGGFLAVLFPHRQTKRFGAAPPRKPQNARIQASRILADSP
jgi:hypothetical protein